MKVNMTPNPLDVVTIHASQGDTEARQWEFELHNNGELIDTSDVSEQMFFKAYKGGTEQILPENGSTPTTSPFLGDIRYPQGLLTDQEFLYRESPTEEDGLAKITDVKGNTLVWNQLQQSASESQTINGITYTLNNDESITANGTSTATSIFYLPRIGQLYANHKYLVKGCPSGGTAQTYMLTFRCNAFSTILGNETGNGIIVNGQDYNDGQMGIRITNGVTLNNAKFYPQAFDLTKMDLDSIASVDEFSSLFSLPFYGYNEGSLLSFNGTGIKTVGKNKFNLTRDIDVTIGGVTFKSNADKSITVNGTATANATITQLNGFTVPNIKKGESLIWSGGLNRPLEQAYLQLVYKGDVTGQTYSFVSVNNQSVLINATENMTLSGVYISCRNGNTFNNETFYPMLRYANTDSTFEPYTSSTLSFSLPTLRSSGKTNYDELTYEEGNTYKHTVKVGMVTYDGSSDEYWTTQNDLFFLVPFPSDYGGKRLVTNSAVSSANVICNKGNIQGYESLDNGAYGYGVGYGFRAYINNEIEAVSSNLSAFRTWLSNNPLTFYYPLAAPTETPFTTASLVTENAEIPLSNEDGVLIGKCTEQLSENPGFFDAKIKLSDADGTCYSNKIQLHIERSPQ